VHPDPAQLEMLSAVIAGMGYEAIPTSKPEEALKLVERGQCRLVLVDVHMPEMDGYDFLDRALRSDSGVHVILMTGDYTLDSALEGIRRGASDFLPNPALEEIAGRSRGAVRPAAAREGARGATVEGSGISRHRRKRPGDAGSI